MLQPRSSLGSTIFLRHPTTDDAIKLFFPGQKISLKPLDCPEVSFTISKLSMPVTKSVVVLAKPDMGDSEQVVIKIYDPRYLDERFETPPLPSYPWIFSNEHAAAMARPQNAELSEEELDKIYSDSPEDLSGEDLTTHYLLWEEKFYRLMMESYNAEHKAYKHLKDLQGSVIPHLIMAGQFLPPDERAIQPPALVLQHIPSVNLYDVSYAAITPAIRTQLISAIESFPSYGVVHNDITPTNICFTPPEQPVRAIVIDFGYSMMREEAEDDYWTTCGALDVRWAKRLLEDQTLIRKFVADESVSRFM